jgi:hypothetical protein
VRGKCKESISIKFDKIGFAYPARPVEALAVVDEALRIMEGGADIALVQPEGGDGYGRAGFGRAGGMI